MCRSLYLQEGYDTNFKLAKDICVSNWNIELRTNEFLFTKEVKIPQQHCIRTDSFEKRVKML